MIQFKHIKFDMCPDCGCDQGTATKQLGAHTNGDHNETVTFWCGYALNYSPNFQSFTVLDQCGRTEKERKRKEAVQKMVEEKLEQMFGPGKVKSAYINDFDDVKRSLTKYYDKVTE